MVLKCELSKDFSDGLQSCRERILDNSLGKIIRKHESFLVARRRKRGENLFPSGAPRYF